nr:lysophospholipid acyltransferase family protein [Neorhodopirellula pilleata]
MKSVADSNPATHRGVVARPAAWFQNGFHRFLETYLKRHFHAIAVQTESVPAAELIPSDPSTPMIVYCNHPSWWDPLLAHFINSRCFVPRQLYAPIDASALQRYQVFEKLGFFGVDLNSTSGAAAFLRTTTELFKRDSSALWLTPEGRFADVRDHAAELMPGLSHLCWKLDAGIVVPLSLEYVFWEERLPECLFRFGEIVRIEDFPERTKTEWSEDLATRLRENQSRLAELSIARNAQPFTNLLRGKQGARGVYDWSRRMKAWMTGKSFQAAHGEKFVE